MSKVIFVDTSRTARGGKRRRPHICYDDERTFEVYKLTKLKKYNEIFIDALFPETYNEILKLLRKGVKIYCLKDTMMMKKLREESNLRKTDVIDAMALARISKDHFKQLTIEELEKRIELDSLISRHKLFTRRIKTLKQWIKRDGWDYGLRDVVRLMERDKKRVAKKIVEAISSNAVYGEACKILGIKGDSIGLAILTAKLPLHLPLNFCKLSSF